MLLSFYFIVVLQVFRSMLLNHELSGQTNPSVILWDTSMEQLMLILDFMYFGEIKVVPYIGSYNYLRA